MQRIAVIGGTGMTGQCVVDHALKKGLKVRLLYRTMETVPDRFKDKVELVQGDVTNKEDCKRVVEGVDGVCIILGTRNKLEATTAMSTGTANLIESMKATKVPIFSIVMSAFLFRKDSEVPPMFHNLNLEHKKMLDLTKDSGLNYVAILPPHIAEDAAVGYITAHDESPGRVVTKYDLGEFVVDSLEQKEHHGKVCGVANKV